MANLDLGNVMGPQGPQGEQGEAGPQGPQGPQGEQGPPADTSALMPKTGGSFTGPVTLTDANISGTLNEITPDNYLRQEYKKLQVSSGTPALDDIINGFGFCYADSTGGVGHGGAYLSVSGWENNSYRLQLMSAGWKSLLSFRTRNGDKEAWNAWANVLADNIDMEITAKHGYNGSNYPQIYGNGNKLHLGYEDSAGSGVMVMQGAFSPAADNGAAGQCYLGDSNRRWRAVYAASGTIQTSDRNAKHDITDLDPDKMTAFVMGLKPSSYIFNDADSGRTHFGLISQDIEELLPQVGMTDMDFAGFIRSPKTEEYFEDVSEVVKDEETGEEKTVARKKLKTREIEGEYLYSLRYDEFIAPLICMVQKQQKEIEHQQEQIEALEQRLSALENKVE